MRLATSEQFKAAMQLHGAAVTVVTTRAPGDGAPHGVTASAVCSVSADPPTLLVCINRAASIHPHLAASGVFCVNLLSLEQRELALRFSSADEAARRRRFEGLALADLGTSAPAIAGCLASFDCRVTSATDHETHTVFIGRVEAIACAEAPPEAAAALMWAARRFGSVIPLSAS